MVSSERQSQKSGLQTSAEAPVWKMLVSSSHNEAELQQEQYTHGQGGRGDGGQPVPRRGKKRKKNRDGKR